jgi:hypothetical protein
MRKTLLLTAIAAALVACGDTQISSPKSKAPESRSSSLAGDVDLKAAAGKTTTPAFSIVYVKGQAQVINRGDYILDAYAPCPADSKVIGGGFEYPSGAFSNADFIPQVSLPDTVNNRWKVQIFFGNNGGESLLTLIPYAVCIK